MTDPGFPIANFDNNSSIASGKFTGFTTPRRHHNALVCSINPNTTDRILTKGNANRDDRINAILGVDEAIDPLMGLKEGNECHNQNTNGGTDANRRQNIARD